MFWHNLLNRHKWKDVATNTKTTTTEISNDKREFYAKIVTEHIEIEQTCEVCNKERTIRVK